MDIYDLFNFIKNEEFEKIEKLIDDKNNNINFIIDEVDFNIKDDNNNYFINYLVIQNKYELLDKLLKSINNIRLDIFDSENKSILYIPIKFNYKKLFDILITHNKKSVGVSICDIRDNLGHIALHYAIKNKNTYFIDTLLQNDSNTLFADKNGNNALHQSIFTRDLEIIKLIIKYSNKNIIINSRTSTGETALHYSISIGDIKIAKLLINEGADINYQDYEHEYNLLHYAIILGSVDFVKLSIENNIDINCQDVFGNTPLHYCILEDNPIIFDILIKSNKQINVNLWNIDGKLPMHLIFEKKLNNAQLFLNYLIEYTNLNLQDNNYTSCLHLLCMYELWDRYIDTLKIKKLDIVLKNNKNMRPIDYIPKASQSKFIDMVIESYLSNLKQNKIWENEWENICKLDLESSTFTTDEIKLLKNEDIKINNKKTKHENCKEIIKNKLLNIINDENKKCSIKSFPVKRGRMCINLTDNNENLQFCTFTGSTLDMLLGLIYLLRKHKNACSILSTDFKENKQLNVTYDNLGVIMSSKYEFLNFEIIWTYYKLHFISNFENIIDKCLVNDSKRFIVIPLGIELEIGSHANYILIDKNNWEIERFEPHGSSNPYNFNYNKELLDSNLEKKFTEIFEKKINKKIKYIKPNEYLPKISLQMLDVSEKKKKKIGDPGGFCALWSIYYTDLRLTYPEYPRNELVNYIINSIKEQNLSYKNLIRNYSIKIIEIRDSILNKANININDWLNDDISNNQFDIVVNEINNIINKIY